MFLVRIAVWRAAAAVALLSTTVARLPGAEPAGTNELSVDVGEAKAIFRKISPRTAQIDYPDFYLLETEVTNRLYREYLRATKKSKDDVAIVEADKQRFQEAVAAQRRKSESGVEYRNGRPVLKIPSPTARPGVVRVDVTETNVRMAGSYYLDTNERMLWSQGDYRTGLDEHPVAFVTLPEAEAFCDWLSERHPKLGMFRLPTWNEWMIGAYGRSRRYPWGDDWDASFAHIGYGDVRRETEPVKGRPKDRTPEGLYGMLGNVAEYLASEDRRGLEYFNLNTSWMGGAFDLAAGFPLKKFAPPLPPRKDYWGYRHEIAWRDQGMGFRVLLDVTRDKTLLTRPRVFGQIDDAWRITPPAGSRREKSTD
jgi:hypothetical protein